MFGKTSGFYISLFKLLTECMMTPLTVMADKTGDVMSKEDSLSFLELFNLFSYFLNLSHYFVSKNSSPCHAFINYFA
jgi:hypothetical protein